MTARSLVITEKPSAARRIAEALDEKGKPAPFRKSNVPYYIASKKGRELVVVSALGHLYTVVQDGGEWTYPVYDYKWAPAYQAGGSGGTRPFIDVIRGLSSGIDEYISACDFDMEGSLIAYNIIRYACGRGSLSNASRMRYSTLTRSDLNRAWKNRSSELDYPVIAAGKARHEVDWLFGINLSRALTLSVKNTAGDHKTLSIGRVQGPTLNFIRKRDVEIDAFVPIPYWIIKAETTLDGENYPLEYDDRSLQTEEEAKKLTSTCRGREGLLGDVISKRRKQYPPPPFNLGDLQREAYRHYKYSPRTTLNAAEKLYLDAFISYPRTESQRLPPSINIKGILHELRKRSQYRDEVESLLSKPFLKPRNGRRDDPAHPAIHPTGKLPGRLGKAEYRVYDLVCRRFMACLGESALRENIDAHVDVAGYLFHLRGSRFLKRGWLDLYGRYAKFKEVLIPSLRTGMVIPVSKIGYRRRYTKPPRRYNPSSLLKLMEDESLGTKATRTNIIDTLYKRGYVKGRRLKITELGFAVAETLGRFCVEILNVDMTRELEKDLEAIESGQRRAEEVVREAIDVLDPILQDFKEHEEEIGNCINETLRKQAREERNRMTLGPCPSCETGSIIVVRSRKTGKRFAGCTNYENGCRQSYSLPQKGKIKPTGEICEACGAPIIEVKRGEWKPWRLCINLKCPGKEEEKGK
ncbi:MAG: DNA topoisomerase I [Candidatus Bathyarchaeia archaeon]